MELDWFKKVRDQPAVIRHGRIGVHANLTQKRQCVLAGASRATVTDGKTHEVNVMDDLVLEPGEFSGI